MAIPTFDQMLRPLLALATEQDLTRINATDAMEDVFKLNETERSARIPSGRMTYVRNRAGWAMTFLTKAGLIAKVAPKTYRATDRGKEFLMSHPSSISVPDLRRLPGWEEAWRTSKKEDKGQVIAPEGDHKTPTEVLEAAASALNADLKSRLLAVILEQSPTFFEKLVLDVLLAMGYGGSRDDAAEHLGKSNDEGIDGRIKQDPLGLDQILVQAKRFATDRPVDRKTLQAFYGSMTGQGVNKGIFITTSTFNANATEFVQRGAQAKVVLIDGDDLLDLMLRHKIGVRIERSVEVLGVDQNYFEDDD